MSCLDNFFLKVINRSLNSDIINIDFTLTQFTSDYITIESMGLPITRL